MTDNTRQNYDEIVPVPVPTDTAISFLGLTLHPKTLDELNDLVSIGIRDQKRWIIANHNLHSVYLFHTQPTLREFYARAHWVHIDGMPLVALGRLYGYPLERSQRVTYADWTLPLIALAAGQGWRVFYLGSPKGVAEKGAQELRKLHPTLHIEVNDGYFDARPGSAENEALVARINTYEPDLLMVGMGMPRQEYWIHNNFAQLNAKVILPSGAAIDYIAGAVPTPPRWTGLLGLEWAFRLVNEPRRLFARYLIEPWYILFLLATDFLRKGGRLKSGPAKQL
jgi:N-acetylglucosaminyldiphosphoundecaprenol N-acetyl-beta-D-mannosaminyltransferase